MTTVLVTAPKGAQIRAMRQPATVRNKTSDWIHAPSESWRKFNAADLPHDYLTSNDGQTPGRLYPESELLGLGFTITPADAVPVLQVASE